MSVQERDNFQTRLATLIQLARLPRGSVRNQQAGDRNRAQHKREEHDYIDEAKGLFTFVIDRAEGRPEPAGPVRMHLESSALHE